MIVISLIMLILGWLLGISLLTTLGTITLVIGLILMVLGATGHAVGGRSNWY